MTAVPATLRLRRESTLRSRAARGDATAFAAVYERHHQALYRYCRSILRHEEDAQDALQSTMARAFAALQDEQRDFDIKPWLFRIAHNEAISILRKRRATTELDDIPVLTDLDDQVSEREELRLLQMDLADLPDRQRAALVLRELNGLSHAEIAVVLETSAANVKQTIYEARTALFSAREGREMPCDDVRRMLSDGDGRVLRGRGLRAHLRSCAGCRLFQADIKQREKRLALLAPPLPTAGAAALLAEILGGGTAKLLVVRRARDRRGDRGRDRVLQAAAARERGGRGDDARAQARAPARTDAHARSRPRSPRPSSPARRPSSPRRSSGRRPKKQAAGEEDAAQADADRRGDGAGRPRRGDDRAARPDGGRVCATPRTGKPAQKPAKQDKPAKGKPPKAQKPVKPAKDKAPKAQSPSSRPRSKAPKAQKPAPSAPTPAATRAARTTKPSAEAKTQRGRNEQRLRPNGKATTANDDDEDDD